MSAVTQATFDRRNDHGPFDIIGDVHGCIDELEELLNRLGYGVTWSWSGQWRIPEIASPSGRRIIFVGDLVDRGPGALEVVTLVMTMCERGQALCVPGNHDVKFRRWLDGHHVTTAHGLEATIADFELITSKERAAVSHFIRALPPYLWLNSGQLVVAHAGIKADMIGTTSHKIENFCLYGDVDSGKTARGLPIRYNWAARYDGIPLVTYGHVCVAEPAWVNGTVCIDTGCCFGGSLTALRYPERETVSVPARRTYFERDGSFGLPPVR
jgi:diadenosine tetraphosphatase ApaH/serine/threonine PP2A family protein phosphatase